MSSLPASAMTRLRGVRVDLAGHRALDGVDLDVAPGEVTVLAGPNGAGKTTLLEVVAGVRGMTTGTRTATRSIAFVPQRTAVPDRLPVTVRDVVSVGTWARSRRRPARGRDDRAAVEESLDRLDIAAIAEQPFATLSGGQRQRTLLAQGLAGRADLLLLDEPTTGLDDASGERIRRVLVDEAGRRAAVLCVSHDPLMLAAADRVVRLEKGRITRGPARETDAADAARPHGLDRPPFDHQPRPAPSAVPPRPRLVFAAPPGWPPPPPGWVPEPGWAPPGSWPSPPEGWRFWVAV